MKSVFWVLIGALAVLAGCGKEERSEGLRLAKLLSTKQADSTSANTIERDLVASARAWCAGIAEKGAGKGEELEQNATVATELAKSAVSASSHLSQVRQAVFDESFRKEYPQTVRNDLITELTKRQRQLQELRTLLEQSAPQFLQYKRDRAYAGDQYPGEIGKLNTLLQAYKPPPDAVESALTALKTKYKFASGEL